MSNADVEIVSIFTDGYAILLIGNPPAEGTCDYWGYRFRFDASTSSGDQMYKALMVSASTGRPVDIWYSDSSVPGTNQHNGCTQDAMAVLNGVGSKKE